MDTATLTLHYPGQEITLTVPTAKAQEFLAIYQEWSSRLEPFRFFVLEDEYEYRSFRLDTLCSFRIGWKRRPAQSLEVW